MQHTLATHIAMDYRQALAKGEALPDRTQGAVLFADISGFTPLTIALAQELGPQRGAEELTQHLNRVYGALIVEAHHYRGSVISFAGDAITCWFDQDKGPKAAACALAMQQVMTDYTSLTTPRGTTIPFGIKTAVIAGTARRFVVEHPKIKMIDVLAGALLERMAAAEQQLHSGEAVLGAEIMGWLGNLAQIEPWPELPPLASDATRG